MCIEGEQVGLERGRSLLVSDKDLEAVDHVGQGDGAVVAPLVHNVVVVDGYHQVAVGRCSWPKNAVILSNIPGVPMRSYI